MFRSLAALSVSSPGKWGVFIVTVLVPGSFVVLAMVLLGGELRRWWRSGDPAERYLAEATTHAELERRMRILERASGGPAFVTFNH